jgi:hypothetical protein
VKRDLGLVVAAAIAASLVASVAAVGASHYLISSSSQIRSGVIQVKHLSKAARKALHGATGARGPRGLTGRQGPPGTATIADGAIGTSKLADGAVTAAKLAPGAITRGALPAALSVDVELINVDQAIPNNGSTFVSFDTTVSDTGGFFDPAQPDHLTAPRDGTYAISAGLSWAFNNSGFRLIDIFGPGGINLAQNQVLAFGRSYMSCSAIARLHAGDIIQLRAGQGSGGVLDLQTSAGARAATLSMAWIGS